jgi:hypothetical protein
LDPPQKIIRPYPIHRTKKVGADSLVKITEMPGEHGFDHDQDAIYALTKAESDLHPYSRTAILNYFNAVRMALVHPHLPRAKWARNDYEEDEVFDDENNDVKGDGEDDQGESWGEVLHELARARKGWQSSPRLDKAIDIYDEYRKKNEVVADTIFLSTWRGALDLLQLAMLDRYGPEDAPQIFRIDGSMDECVRNERVEQFLEADMGTVLLATYGFIGEVVTIPSAGQVICLNTSWTGKDEERARCRLHRRPQSRPVKWSVLHCPTNFVEAYIVHLQQKKMRLRHQVIKRYTAIGALVPANYTNDEIINEMTNAWRDSSLPNFFEEQVKKGSLSRNIDPKSLFGYLKAIHGLRGTLKFAMKREIALIANSKAISNIGCLI